MYKKITKILSIVLITSILFTSCRSSVTKDGFKVVDGKKVYMENNFVVYDKLVNINGEQYYISKDGTKITNDWAVVDNDGNMAYFGAKGQIIKNQLKEIDGKFYLLDENVFKAKKGFNEFNGNKYYVSNDGVVLKESLENIDGKDLYFDSGSF